MKLRDISFFKSKNKRLFFKGAGLLLLLMGLFYIGNPTAKTVESYLSFGFLWLSVIIAVCFTYLIPRDKERTREILFVGLGCYLGANTLANLLLPVVAGLYTLIAVDFLLTFAIIILGLILYFGGNRKDSQF